MAQQKGSTGQIMLGYESVAYATAATDGYVLPVGYGDSLMPSQTRTDRNLIRSSRNPVEGILGFRDVSGSVPIPVDSVALIYWLVAMFGDPTSTGGPNYVHEFKIGSSMPSFTLEKAFTDLDTAQYCQYLGCKTSGFSIEFGGEGALDLNIDIAGAKENWATSSIDGTPTTPTPAYINQFQGAVQEGGSNSGIITRGTVNVNFGLDLRTENIPINSQGVRAGIPEGAVQVNGQVTAQFTDAGYTMLAKGPAGTETSLKFTYTASTSSVFELELQEIKLDRTAPAYENPEGMLVTMNYNAFYNDGSEASAIVARVTNATESYNLV